MEHKSVVKLFVSIIFTLMYYVLCTVPKREKVATIETMLIIVPM